MIQQLMLISKDDNLHLIVPLLLRVISRTSYNETRLNAELNFKVEIVRTLHSLILCKSFREYTATIVHSMLNMIEVYHSYATREAIDL